MVRKETTEATLNNALAFTEDFDCVKGGRELIDSHENFCVDICEGFLKDAIKIKDQFKLILEEKYNIVNQLHY